MIPVERVAALLADHLWMSAYLACACTKPWDNDVDAMEEDEHAQHQALVLADAGLIPTQREWGVREERNGGIYVDTFSSRQSAERYMTEYKSPEIVTRWVGTTAWEATNE